MCGRYAQGRAIPELVARYARLGAILLAEEQGLHAAFNLAPSKRAAVLHAAVDGLRLEAMQWGLVPRWAKSLDALKSKPINARSETAATGAMFRDAFRTGRCIVPATGFYEWQGSKPPKQPWFIHARDEDILSFAGLCAHWKDPASGATLHTFTILTTEANETVKPIHDRMPCILRRDEEEAWLSTTTTPEACQALLHPYPADRTAAHPVSTAVNKPGNDSPELTSPIGTMPTDELFPFT